MVNVILNGKPYQCASCKEELNIGQYQRILREWNSSDPDLLKRDNINLFGILTNTDFKHASLSLESEQAIFECISWVFTESFEYPKDMPKVLEIGDKAILLPTKVGACSIGQNIILKQILDSCTYMEEGLSLAVAIYLQPQYDTKEKKWYEFWIEEKKKAVFNYGQAKELEKDILQMPAQVVYPIGFFLLNRVLTNGRKQAGIWHLIKSSLNLK